MHACGYSRGFLLGVGLSTTAIFGDLNGLAYFLENFRDDKQYYMPLVGLWLIAKWMTLNDLERPIHLKVRLADGTLDVRMLWLSDLTMRHRTALFPVRSIPRWRLGPFWKTSNGHNSAARHPIHFVFGSRVGFSGTVARTALFPVRSNPRRRPAAIFKMSNGHISATHYPLHFMYVHWPYNLPSDAAKTLEMRLDTYLAIAREGND